MEQFQLVILTLQKFIVCQKRLKMVWSIIVLIRTAARIVYIVTYIPTLDNIELYNHEISNVVTVSELFELELFYPNVYEFLTRLQVRKDYQARL